MNLLDPEVALVLGPFSLASEYIWVDTDMDSADDPNFYGYYISAGYFLTGEQKKYITDQGGGEFGAIKPASNFSLDGSGIGAWEIAARYS